MTHNTGDPNKPKAVETNVLNHRRPPRRIPKTITVFDGYAVGGGDSSASNIGILCDLNVSSTSLFPKNKHAPKSLVIESLIEQLCSFLEKDQKKRNQLFSVICNSLSNWKVLDAKFHNETMHGIRLQFRVAFEKYITQMKNSIQHLDQPSELLLSITIPEWDRKESLSSCLYQNCYPNTHFYELYTRQYERDFVEQEIIDKGAFGIVFKAMKKVEKVEYAVKKIPFSCDNEDPLLPNVLREVEVFARLSHSNVVSYKTAWIEPALGDISDFFGSSNETSTETLELSSKNQKSVRSSPILEEEEESLTRSDSLGFETSNLRENVYNSFLNQHESLQLNSYKEIMVTRSSILEEQEQLFKRTKNDSFSIEDSKLSSEEFNIMLDQMVERYDSGEFTTDLQAGILSSSVRNRHFSGDTSKSLSDSELDHSETFDQSCRQKLFSKNDLALVPTFKRSKSLNAENKFSFNGAGSKITTNAILYVQMELCKYSLRKWLDERNATGKVDTKSATNIFKQILKGVQYLHSQDLMHRDLKPQNILFDSQDRVKIGDFGLATACCCFNRDNLKKTNKKHTFGHSQGVGTSPYSAPEVKNGTSYDTKADMYSLGVILLELFYPFVTGMERAIVIESDLPKGKLPNEFKQKFPEQTRVILDLTNFKPKLRPGASDVLNSQLFLSKTQVIAKQEMEIKNLKKYVMKLKAKIRILERQKKTIATPPLVRH